MFYMFVFVFFVEIFCGCIVFVKSCFDSLFFCVIKFCYFEDVVVIVELVCGDEDGGIGLIFCCR